MRQGLKALPKLTLLDCQSYIWGYIPSQFQLPIHLAEEMLFLKNSFTRALSLNRVLLEMEPPHLLSRQRVLQFTAASSSSPPSFQQVYYLSAASSLTAKRKRGGFTGATLFCLFTTTKNSQVHKKENEYFWNFAARQCSLLNSLTAILTKIIQNLRPRENIIQERCVWCCLHSDMFWVNDSSM